MFFWYKIVFCKLFIAKTDCNLHFSTKHLILLINLKSYIMYNSNTDLSMCQRLEQFGKYNSEYYIWGKYFTKWQKISIVVLYMVFVALVLGSLKILIMDKINYGDIYYILTLIILFGCYFCTGKYLATRYRKTVFEKIYVQDHKEKTAKTISNKDIRENNLFVFFAKNNICQSSDSYKILRDEFMLYKNYNTLNTNIISASVAIVGTALFGLFVEKQYDYITTELGSRCEVIMLFIVIVLFFIVSIFVLIKLISNSYLFYLRNVNQKYTIVFDLLGELIIKSTTKNK